MRFIDNHKIGEDEVFKVTYLSDRRFKDIFCNSRKIAMLNNPNSPRVNPVSIDRWQGLAPPGTDDLIRDNDRDPVRIGGVGLAPFGLLVSPLVGKVDHDRRCDIGLSESDSVAEHRPTIFVENADKPCRSLSLIGSGLVVEGTCVKVRHITEPIIENLPALQLHLLIPGAIGKSLDSPSPGAMPVTIDKSSHEEITMS